MICSACNKELLSGDAFLECTMDSCNKVYHYLCYNRELAFEEKLTWVCPECCCANRKGGRNCEIPITINTPIVSRNVSSRNKSYYSVPQSPDGTMESREMQMLREQINTLTKQLADAVETINKYHFALTDCVKKIDTCSEKLNQLELRPPCCHSPNVSPPLPSNDKNNTKLLRSFQKGNIVKKQNKQTNTEMTNNNSTQLAPDQPQRTPSVENASTITMSSQEALENSSTITIPSQDYALINNQGTGKDEWVEVVRKRPRSNRISSVLGTAGPETTSLKAVEPRKYIHLWNMMSGPDDILAYLNKLSSGINCTVEELKPKGDYKSFKIGVPADLFDKFMSPNVWPANAKIKKWFFRRQYNPKRQ